VPLTNAVTRKAIIPIASCFLENARVTPKKKHVRNGTTTIGGSKGYTVLKIIDSSTPSVAEAIATIAVSFELK